MKCPACGFDTPESQGYCDFCKEPFRRADPPAHPSAAKPVEVSKEVLRKLEEVRASAGAAPADKGIPPEFASLDAGERVPEISPFVRRLAWVFLAFWLTVLALVVVLAKSRRRGPAAAAGPATFSSPPSGPR